MSAALVADQERVAIGEIARAFRPGMRHHQPTIGVVRLPRCDSLGDDPARGVLAEMQHLGAGIDLLVTIGNRDRVELTARIVPTQYATRIFPGDGGTGLELGPGNLRVLAAAVAALGHEIVDAAAPAGVARVPVLDGR